MNEEKAKPIVTTESMMAYASSTMLKFAGSLLVLSFAINNIKQLDKIADAYAEVIVITARAETQSCPIPQTNIIPDPIDFTPITDRLIILDEIGQRIEILESMAHPLGAK